MWPWKKKSEYPNIEVKDDLTDCIIYVEGVRFCKLNKGIGNEGMTLVIMSNDGYWRRTAVVYKSKKDAIGNLRTMIKNCGIQYFLYTLRNGNAEHAAKVLFNSQKESMCASCPHKKFHDEHKEKKIRKLEVDE